MDNYYQIVGIVLCTTVTINIDEPVVDVFFAIKEIDDALRIGWVFRSRLRASGTASLGGCSASRQGRAIQRSGILCIRIWFSECTLRQ
jgi:hypothetical protein